MILLGVLLGTLTILLSGVLRGYKNERESSQSTKTVGIAIDEVGVGRSLDLVWLDYFWSKSREFSKVLVRHDNIKYLLHVFWKKKGEKKRRQAL